jgi:hypothetical protein
VVTNGSLTTAWFERGTTSAYGHQTPPRSLGSGTTSVSLTESLSNLLPNITHHVRVVAQNSCWGGGRVEMFRYRVLGEGESPRLRKGYLRGRRDGLDRVIFKWAVTRTVPI